MEWRLVDPCPAVHPDGSLCDGERGHDGDHVMSVWQTEIVDGEPESYPAYPVYWKD